jgi:Bacterial Ig-like domain
LEENLTRMTHSKKTALVLVLSTIAAFGLLSGCSGGGGDGGGRLILITADGATEPLWELVNGVPTVPPACPTGVYVNARITFTFDGPVDPASVPVFPFAAGSLTIATEITGIPAQGTFTVEDDPAFPAGNRRRVVFNPALPSIPGMPCATGIAPLETYEVSVPFGTGAGMVIVVDGEPITAGALTCFRSCGCPDGGGCVTRFTDPVSGPPFVTSTTPATGDLAAAPAVDRCAVGQNTIQINVSEALNPVGIDLANVRVVNVATGAQLPGSLVFIQATTGGPSRIDYVAASTLPAGTTFQILFGPAVQDFGGNPIQPLPLYFQTMASPPVSQSLVEQFDTANPAGASGAAQWTGTGFLQGVFPLELTGTGADGAFAAPAGITTILDTNEIVVGGQSRMGIWNFTNVIIPATAIVRIVGPYQAHFRCTGTVVLDGTVNVDFGMPGSEMGVQNNGGGTNCEALGGVANAGGGNGGTGSGVTPPPGSPPTFQCAIRTSQGENGYGPTIGGTLNPGTPSNILYAGGQGGDSGCFPAAGTGCTLGDLGGLGGAGGTAGRIGEAGLPRVSTAACSPTPGVIQPIAQPSPIAPAMIPPVALQSAGSGGGGGGDHWDVTGTPPSNDDQGAGGGAGGGGLRISSIGSFSMTGGMISARGSQGNTAQAFGGGGGSGSGGEVWIQTFSTLFVSATATIDVTGPGRFAPIVGSIGCSNQAAGGGGAGLVQLEAGQGATPTPNFNLFPTPTPTTGAVFSAPPFAFAGTITGQGRSGLRYTGSPAPDYTGAVEVFSLGNAAGATLTIRYEGALEAINSTPGNPVPDPATVKSMATGGGPITAANLDELDGYPFIEFVVDIFFPGPPGTSPSATLPSVDSITINFDTAQACP